MGERVWVAVVAMGLALSAGCGSDDDSSPESGQEDPAADVDDSGALTFTFSGVDGEAGCRYDGPTEIGRDFTSSFTNETEGEANVTFARLAADATPEDFEAYLDTLGDSYPVVVPPADSNSLRHEWMEGEWLELHTAPAGESQTVERSAVFEGDYVAFCFRGSATSSGSEVWPAGTITVTDLSS